MANWLREENERFPIYENIIRVDNVSIIDHRIIRILNRVHEAPQLIRSETEQFTRFIDHLKRLYLSSIIKRQRAEKRYNESVAHKEACKRRLESCVSNNQYFIPTEDDVSYLEKELTRANIELILANSILDCSVRELLLHREQLCLLSKKAEHCFVGFLRKTADKHWADMYMSANNEQQECDDEEFLPPKLVYHVDLRNENDSDETVSRTPPEEGEFEWDATFDDHFIPAFPAETLSHESIHEAQERDIIKRFSYCDLDEDTSHDGGTGSEHQLNNKPQLYKSEPLFISRRRCRLTRNIHPKKLIRYFKNIVHGPWEGWEDL